jgi:aminoglycoside-2''-adenylyltransferase
MQRAQRQLRLIGEVVTMSDRLSVEIWLRGGWAMDFFLGDVTRDHQDVDWFAWAADAPAITEALKKDAYRFIAGPPPDQQLDVAKDGEELSFAWLAGDRDGRVTVAGGPWAGARWPDGMLSWPPGSIGSLRCPIISPIAQIEIKTMMPVWVPGRARRLKDTEDIARLRRGMPHR